MPRAGSRRTTSPRLAGRWTIAVADVREERPRARAATSSSPAAQAGAKKVTCSAAAAVRIRGESGDRVTGRRSRAGRRGLVVTIRRGRRGPRIRSSSERAVRRRSPDAKLPACASDCPEPAQDRGRGLRTLSHDLHADPSSSERLGGFSTASTAFSDAIATASCVRSGSRVVSFWSCMPGRHQDLRPALVAVLAEQLDHLERRGRRRSGCRRRARRTGCTSRACPAGRTRRSPRSSRSAGSWCRSAGAGARSSARSPGVRSSPAS